MLGSMRFKATNILVWIILVLLIFGLAGFGISDMLRGGISNEIGSIGDQKITREQYANAMNAQLQRLSQRAGRQITIAEARQFGIDRAVLAELARRAALDAEAERLGIGADMATVQKRISMIPEFQGPDGTFNAQQARLVLQQSRMDEADLREDVGSEVKQNILAAAVASGITAPQGLLQTIFAWRNEQRGFTWVKLPANRFGEAPDAPDDATLQAWHDEHSADYTLPETREVTYALLDPAKLTADVDVPEDALRAEYERRAAQYDIPERRSLSRLAFASQADAEAAKAAIDAGETTLTALAAERGLEPSDIDLGERAETQLAASARGPVFGTDAPGVVGPVETDLGPALFEISAILAPQHTSFEDARAEIHEALATRDAVERATGIATEVEDLVAGGATVEEIAQETPFELATLEVPADGSGTGLATDTNFRQTALGAQEKVESDLTQTADKRYFVLRVDSIRPEAVQPLDEVRDRVLADWTAEQKRQSAHAAAQALADRISGGEAFSRAAISLGITPGDAGPVTRSQQVENLPAEAVSAVFTLDPNGVAVADDDTGSYVLQLRNVTSFDPGAPQAQAMMTQAQTQIDQSMTEDVMQAYVYALENAEDGLRVDMNAVDTVLSQMR
ncbi:peptidylprolyl isomerase [Oceanicella sp. SM1341]|uniref:peptidylprolyl isomerase n=1 Tax=Oceanicella sp. SM1341 TaxID=1548889 RepID=UPI000E4E3580|nr:peptidylprolyl isomerase [Oceanicella sp. SM1341]